MNQVNQSDLIKPKLGFRSTNQIQSIPNGDFGHPIRFNALKPEIQAT